MGMLGKMMVVLRSLPKTLYFNLHYFPLKKAIKLPILVSYKVRLQQLGDKGSIQCPNHPMSVMLGVSDGSFSMGNHRRSNFCQEKGTKLSFGERTALSNPFYLTVNHGGRVSFGKNFHANTNFVLSCASEIIFEKNCLLGWNVTVIDGDGHSISRKGTKEMENAPAPIHVGKHVWISSNASVLKGSSIPEESVVSMNALVTRKFEEPNVILAGVPAKQIKNEIQWDETWI